MEFSLLSPDGHLFILRWFHFFFGVIWIGHLYYFNFTQVPFFAETDNATKSNAIQKLVPRALWWFRWSALVTFVTGLIYLMARGGQIGEGAWTSSWGVAILTGALLGTIMFLNVWLIIWPNQKVVIESTTNVAQGKPANPAAATSGARALVASRTNTLFSLPMLFFMGAASHLNFSITEESNFNLYWIITLAVIGAIELNAIKGKIGPLATVKGVIHAGVGLMLVMYGIVEVIL